MALLDQTFCDELASGLKDIVSSQESVRNRILMIRPILESLYKNLSKDRGMSFSGLFSRMQYIHDTEEYPHDLVKQANLLRIMCNKVAHENEFQPQDADLASSVFVLMCLLRQAFPGYQDETIDDWLSQNDAKPFPSKSHSRKDTFFCVVNDWQLTRNGDSVSGIIITATGDDGNEVSILLRNSSDGVSGRQWSLLGRSLWRYALLRCVNLSQSDGNPGRYIDNPTCFVILEPDYLIDASSIAECFTKDQPHPELYVVGKLLSEGSTASMMKGTTVNNIFDEVLLQPDSDFQQMFRNSLAKMPLAMVAQGYESSLESYKDIRDRHYPKILEFAKSMQGFQMQLEPTYLCPDYGLQGRIDLLYKKDDKHYVVELKSGQAPQWDVWPQHQMQVIAYNMIIRSCYGISRTGNGSIFYSQAEKDQQRFVVNTVALEQDLIMCRNRVIGILHSLTQEPGQFFAWLCAKDSTGLPPYSVARINEIKAMLNNLESFEYEWFLAQVRLAVSESWFVKIGSDNSSGDSIYGYNALWQQSSEYKLKRYKLLQHMDLLGYEQTILDFRLGSKGSISDFRDGDIVILYREGTPVFKQEILRGIIENISQESMSVRIRGGLNSDLQLMRQYRWSAEHDVLESMLFNPLNSISVFLRETPERRRIILGMDDPRFDYAASVAVDCLDGILAHMQATRDYCIIQGPPGTGKTSGLLKRFIGDLYRDTEQTVLVLSFTNRAVDEICMCLASDSIPFIRTGASQVVSAELLSNRISGMRYLEIKDAVIQNRIWVATVQSCNAWISDFLKVVGKIDTLIIDEASQIIESNILGIMIKAERTILIGDQNQLPPISNQQNTPYHFESSELKELGYTYYNCSLMERLCRIAIEKGRQSVWFMLNRHYRMHQDICALIQHYYDNNLHAVCDRQMQALPMAQSHQALLAHRLIWVECETSPTAFYDARQARTISKLLDKYHDAGLLDSPPSDIGIVAPYRAMIQAIRSELHPRFQDITVDTVERFQGSERDIILISLPLRTPADLRTLSVLSADGMIDRKLNVAISRARERLIIFGNTQLCRNSRHYAFLIDNIRKHGNVVSIEELLKQN